MDRETLQQKTVAELREEAKKIPGAKGISSMKKDELIDLVLAQAGGDTTSTAAPSPKRGATKGPAKDLDRSELKRQIRALKEEKREALTRQDRDLVRACNRRIRDCKRLLRKMTRAAPVKR